MTRKVWFGGVLFAVVLALGAGVAVPAVRAATAQQVRQTRPVALGTSGGNVNEVARGGRSCSSGTLGALVADGTHQYVLSNNHVLARQNKASAGEDISQPGLIDVNCQRIAGDVVADLTGFVPLQFKRGTNTVDAAIAQARAGAVQADGAILGIGTVSSLTATAQVGCAVQKVGRTTGQTAGSVSATNATVTVRYSGGVATFTDQVVITPGSFSAGGDSGSLVVRDGTNPRPVGLLFAGSSTATIANPIDSVLGALGVSMVGTGEGSTGDCPVGEAAATSAQTQARNAKSRVEAALLRLPDVVGVAVGAGGSIEVYLANENAQARRQIPARIDNVPVRIHVTGAFEAR